MADSGLNVGFIGAGRIARIAIEGWARAGQVPRVVASDPNPEVLSALSSMAPAVTATSDNAEAAKQDIVFVAVHPPLLGTVLVDIAPHLRPDAILVSLAPKWTLSRIAAALGGFTRVARVIPNAPSFVGAGFNPVSFAPDMPADARAQLLSVLAPWGEAPVVDESTLEAYAIISAMGPTYLWPQLFRLVSLGGDFGLDPAAARTAVAAMLRGCAATIERTDLTREQAMDLIPVKPLAAFESSWDEAYQATLSELFARLKP